jgi:hypothetical protein
VEETIRKDLEEAVRMARGEEKQMKIETGLSSQLEGLTVR